MKFRILAIATVFASLMGASAAHADDLRWERGHLNGYSSMSYTGVYMYGGQNADVAVKPQGNTTLRLSVYDYHDNLITSTTCRYDTCSLSWSANWNANFYVKVENLSGYETDYGFAIDRE